MEKGCPEVKSGVKYMIPGAKVKNHDVLAHEWFLNFMPRPKYEHKRGAQAPRYANIGQDCGSTKYETIRMVSSIKISN